MNKVGLITLYKNNFGSILQAYSTCSYINSLGYACSILNHVYSNNFYDKLLKVPQVIFKSLKYRDYLQDRKTLRISSQKDNNLLSQYTRVKMDKFVNENLQIENCNSKKIAELNNKYDYFITGSDQVWGKYIPFRFLTFADREKRIALSPSFGANGVKDYYREDIKNALLGFNIVSVREESGVKIIKDLTGKDAIRLADPTILLDKDQWKRYSTNGIIKVNFVLLHFLNKPNELAIKNVNEYLKKHNCVAYCICNKYVEYDQILRCEFLDISPYDYVSLICNANFVFTDSFHSTLFSLNLETQFLTFDRQYLHGNSQSSRILDLLNRVGLEARFVNKDKVKVDFDLLESWDSDEIFKDERNNIKEYLQVALKK